MFRGTTTRKLKTGSWEREYLVLVSLGKFLRKEKHKLHSFAALQGNISLSVVES